MNKALVSFALGEDYTNMLSVALPSYFKYGYLHGYNVFIPSFKNIKQICGSYGWDHNRPISWLKIPLIKYLLGIYDTVLWLDSDIVIHDTSDDIAQNFSYNHLQAFVIHNDIHEGLVPNCGVWLLNKNSIAFLDEIWNQTDFLNHKWWEQGANIHLMNQNVAYKQNSLELPFAFNVHKNDRRFDESSYLDTGKFLHATMWPNRIEQMKHWMSIS